MCGINGIAYARRSSQMVNRHTLVKMRDSLRHRGPDESGVFVRKNIGLGHRRLSIVDLKSGQQPMSNRDESCVIVYNGEVYNHSDYRQELLEKGYEYRSHCDTETILHLYEEYGESCVHKLRGMFAFAIWNEKKQELFIARDRLGVKPLYYCHDQQGGLFFGSEIKALLEAKGVKPELNYDALPDQLANHGTSHEQTLFANIKRLLPGHFLIWCDGNLRVEKYWDISFEPKQDGKSDDDYVNEWGALFRKSVELRLMADVPLGMFLSGGIDSSAICAAMATIVDSPIKTFSVGFKESEANEFEYARIVSRAFNTDHHEIVITPKQFFDELPSAVWHEDEPLGFAASIPLFFVSKLAQEHVKVVLTGEGSDEILAGYGRYAKAVQLINYGEKYESVTPAVFRNAVRSGVATLPASLGRKLSRTFLSQKADIENLFFDNFSVFPKAIQNSLLAPETKARIGDQNPYVHQNEMLGRTDAEGLIDKFLYIDIKTYLHELLMKQDQMSMAASIESRVPFLDHKLVEFTARMPTRFKLRGSNTKWVLRKAMRGILPESILTRSKMGFPVPLGNWFRNQHRHIIDDYVLSERTLARGYFNPDFVREMVAGHLSGEKHDERLWCLVNFEVWNRIFLDGEGLQVA
jgi:asparagine synthase (glutamine-hydrolysing)